jgi:hypothetical protein
VQSVHTRVQAGSNTSIVVGSDGSPPSSGDINKRTWHSSFWESWLWSNKIWWWFPRFSEARITMLARTSSNLSYRSLLSSERAPDLKEPIANSNINLLMSPKFRLDASTGWETQSVLTWRWWVSGITADVHLSWADAMGAGSWGRGQLGNSGLGEPPPLTASTKQRLVKTEEVTLCISVCMHVCAL